MCRHDPPPPFERACYIAQCVLFGGSVVVLIALAGLILFLGMHLEASP